MILQTLFGMVNTVVTAENSHNRIPVPQCTINFYSTSVTIAISSSYWINIFWYFWQL